MSEDETIIPPEPKQRGVIRARLRCMGRGTPSTGDEDRMDYAWLIERFSRETGNCDGWLCASPPANIFFAQNPDAAVRFARKCDAKGVELALYPDNATHAYTVVEHGWETGTRAAPCKADPATAQETGT